MDLLGYVYVQIYHVHVNVRGRVHGRVSVYGWDHVYVNGPSPCCLRNWPSSGVVVYQPLMRSTFYVGYMQM